MCACFGEKHTQLIEKKLIYLLAEEFNPISMDVIPY